MFLKVVSTDMKSNALPVVFSLHHQWSRAATIPLLFHIHSFQSAGTLSN